MAINKIFKMFADTSDRCPVAVLWSCILLLLLTSSSYCQAGTILHGIVRDRSGAVIPDADVGIGSQDVAYVHTDAQGKFELDSLSLPITLHVKAKGFAPFLQTFATAPQAPLEITLQPAGRTENVVVTPERSETEISQTSAAISQISDAEISSTAALTADDLLRQVPGFTLFRRTGSRAANPTTQGVSLRGVGASGASRAVVLYDGLPLTDPFGGWVYWSRVPRAALSSIEVVQGGESALYGSDALGGVINILPKSPKETSLSLETSYGNEQTPDFSALASQSFGKWNVVATGSTFYTDGYLLVSDQAAGFVDTRAGSQNGGAKIRVSRSLSTGESFADASYFSESRKNGTPLQKNNTELAEFSAGSNFQFAGGAATARIYGGPQSYFQTFSSIAADRNSETLTRTQQVPAQQTGGLFQWSRLFAGTHSVTGGTELRQVRGISDEIVYVGGKPSRRVAAGGRQRAVGFFAHDSIRIGSRWRATLGGRVDVWKNYRAFSRSAPFSGVGAATFTDFPSRTETAFSPTGALLFQATRSLSLTASVYGAFRAPTLNELYRSFRVGNVVTTGNDHLTAERLWGGETSARFQFEKLQFRGTFFWNQITDPIANRTLSSTPTLITRQRQNLGSTRSRGVEVEVTAPITSKISFSAGYQYAEPTILSFAAGPSLVGLDIPQTPRNQFTFQAAYINPRNWTVSFQGRAIGYQFEDDQNLSSLGSFFNGDLFVSRKLRSGMEAFVAIENVLDQRYTVARVPTPLLGPPILARGGVRLHLGR